MNKKPELIKKELKNLIEKAFKKEFEANAGEIEELFEDDKPNYEKVLFDLYLARLLSLGINADKAVQYTENFFDKAINIK